jgi:beta-glucosidase
VLQVPASDEYTFLLASDDGARLYLDDELIVDNWGNHGLEERASSPIPLRAGEPHPLRVDYYEAGGAAGVQLSWSSSSFGKRTLSGQFIGRPEPAADDE